MQEFVIYLFILAHMYRLYIKQWQLTESHLPKFQILFAGFSSEEIRNVRLFQLTVDLEVDTELHWEEILLFHPLFMVNLSIDLVIDELQMDAKWKICRHSYICIQLIRNNDLLK